MFAETFEIAGTVGIVETVEISVKVNIAEIDISAGTVEIANCVDNVQIVEFA